MHIFKSGLQMILIIENFELLKFEYRRSTVILFF